MEKEPSMGENPALEQKWKELTNKWDDIVFPTARQLAVSSTTSAEIHTFMDASQKAYVLIINIGGWESCNSFSIP